ncbi:MAG: hypothetical protein ACOYUZ_00490 [Patescibacteria group bacterium]
MTHERNETEVKKPWYKTVLGILFIIFTFPLTLPPVLLYVIWAKSKQDKTVKIILTAVIAIITLVIWIPALSDNKTQTDSKSTQIVENVSENELQPDQEPKSPEPKVEKVKEWVKVFELTASANKQSETFHLEGGQQKVVYETTGGKYAMCTIYVVDEGTSLDETGGFPVVLVDEDKSDETLMRKSAGDYYLDIRVVNGMCDVEIQEYK